MDCSRYGRRGRRALAALTTGIVVATLLVLPGSGLACGPPDKPDPSTPKGPISCPNNECHQCSMSPCYAKNGAFNFTVEDLSIPTPGLPLRISRYYDSARPYDGPIGIGWTLNLPTRLFYSTYKFTAPSTYLNEADVTFPNGDRWAFTENAGAFTPPVGRHDALIKNADSSFDLSVQKSRVKYHFSSSGAVTSMTDESGNAVNLTYDGNGRLQTVADAAGSGRSFTLTWGIDGRIASIQDSGGRIVRFAYTTGNLTTVTDPANRTTTYQYNEGGTVRLMSAAIDNWGRQIIGVNYDDKTYQALNIQFGSEDFDYKYGNNGVPNLTIKSEQGTDGGWWIYYSPEGWVTDRSRVYGSLNTTGPTQHTDYYPDGSVQQEVDEVGVKTYYTYNANGSMATVIRDYQGLNAIQFSYSYDPNFPDRVISITPVDPASGQRNLDWQMWKYDYYQAGAPSPGALFHVYRVHNDTQQTADTVATYVYNAKGQVTQFADGSNHTTDYTYDANWNLWTTTAPANNDVGTPRPITTYGYDALGRVTSATDPLGHITSYQYDNVNRLLSVTLPKPSASSTLVFATTYSYDNYDSATSLVFANITDPNNKVTTQGYDYAGQLVKSVDVQGHVTAYTYSNGLMTGITDANQNAITYEYDRLARILTGTRRADGNPLDAWTYNDDGTLQIFYSRDGWRRNTYDHLKRVTRRDSAAPYFTFTFVGQKLSQVDQGDGYGWTQTDTMTYDASYRLQAVTEGTRGTVTYGYNLDDTLVSSAVTGGPTATYSYYPDRSLNTINWTPIAGQFKYLYTLAGQYQTLTYPNGGSRNYSYDDQGRLNALSNIDPIAGNLASYGYGYDYNYTTGQTTMLGQRSSATATVPSQGLSNQLFKYEYDPLYQLNKVTYPNVAPFSGEVDSWTYDAIGNRLTNTVNGTTQTYSYEQVVGHQGQRLNSDGVNSYTYYGGGLSGSIGSRSGPGGNFTFTWTPWGQMSQVNSGNLANYYYDYQGRRFQKSVTGTATNYLYDGLNLIRESTGVTTTEYLFGPGIDEPIAMSRGGQGYYFAVDGLGSVSVIASPAGAVQNNYLFDVWGTLRNTPTAFANSFGYTAREFGDVGTSFYRARYYQSSVGRFLSEDPLDGAASANPSMAGAMMILSLRLPARDLIRFGSPAMLDPARTTRYSYVLNAPASFTDPDGWAIYDGDCAKRQAATALTQSMVMAFSIGFPGGWRGLDDGPADAYRHCLWSCLMSKMCGGSTALLAGTGHEVVDNHFWPVGSSVMDMNNNAQGRQCGDMPCPCHACCLGKVRTGTTQNHR